MSILNLSPTAMVQEMGHKLDLGLTAITTRLDRIVELLENQQEHKHEKERWS